MSSNHYGVWYNYFKTNRGALGAFKRYIKNDNLESYRGRSVCFASIRQIFKEDCNCYISFSSPMWYTKVIDELNKFYENIHITTLFQHNLFQHEIVYKSSWGDNITYRFSEIEESDKPFCFPYLKIEKTGYTLEGGFIIDATMCYFLRLFTLGEEHCENQFDDPNPENYIQYLLNRNNKLGALGHNFYNKKATLEILKMFDNVELINKLFTGKVSKNYCTIGSEYGFQPTPAITYLLENKGE